MLDSVGNDGWRREYARYHKVVVDPVSGATTVAARVPGLGEGGSRAADSAAVAEAVKVMGKARRDIGLSQAAKGKGKGGHPVDRVKKVSLVQLFEDADLQVSLDLSPEFCDLLGRQAVVDPVKACAIAQRVLSEKGERIQIFPGKYVSSLRAARAAILSAAETTDAASRVSIDIIVEGNRAMCEGGKVVAGVKEWFVSGPLWRAHEVVCIARLATARGSTVINCLLESQMLICGIELIEQGGVGLPVSDVRMCSGPLMTGYPGVDGATLSHEMRSAAQRISPVTSAGRVVATAVHLSDTSSVLNWHVVEQLSDGAETNLRVGRDSSSVSVEMAHSAGYDLWVTSHDKLDFSVGPWLRRAAERGETARLVYSGLKCAEFSDPVRLVYVENGSLVSSLPSQVRGGVSGAALVAESDGALLGVFYGHTVDKCVFSVLSADAQYTSDAEIIRAERMTATTSSDDLYASFQRRGLESVVSSVASAIEPLYVGKQHVAAALVVGPGLLRTTVNPEVVPASMPGSRGVFRPAGVDKYEALVEFAVHRVIGFVRDPVVGEEVCVMSKDEKGAYFSQVLVVTKLGSDSTSSFWLGGLPSGEFEFSGGVVLALADAAVVGQYVAREGGSDLARCASAVSRSASAAVESSVVVAVRDAFPDLHPVAWDRSQLEGIFSLDSRLLSQYVALGKTAVRSSVMLQLARQGDEEGMVALARCLEGPGWLLGKAIDCRFVQLFDLVSDKGSSRVTHGKLVDVFLALLGMAAVFEDEAGFRAFVTALDLCDTTVTSPVARTAPRELKSILWGGHTPIDAQPRPLSWA
jgi:hypothetical protein